MKEYILKQLKDRSSVKGKQRTWVSDLTDEQLYELFLRLRCGENAKAIARNIQAAWGVNPDATVHSVSQGILKFQKRIAHLLITPASEEKDSYPGPYSCDFDSEDTLESLDYIARIQRDRIIAMVEQEKETGIKHPYLNRDLQALATLQKVILKQRAFEMIHDDPVKRKKLERVQKRFGNWMEQIGEDRRLKMANALTNFLEYVENNCEMMERLPDGTYHKIERKK